MCCWKSTPQAASSAETSLCSHTLLVFTSFTKPSFISSSGTQRERSCVCVRLKINPEFYLKRFRVGCCGSTGVKNKKKTGFSLSRSTSAPEILERCFQSRDVKPRLFHTVCTAVCHAAAAAAARTHTHTQAHGGCRDLLPAKLVNVTL